MDHPLGISSPCFVTYFGSFEMRGHRRIGWNAMSVTTLFVQLFVVLEEKFE
jgi:hypothetical protein